MEDKKEDKIETLIFWSFAHCIESSPSLVALNIKSSSMSILSPITNKSTKAIGTNICYVIITQSSSLSSNVVEAIIISNVLEFWRKIQI